MKIQKWWNNFISLVFLATLFVCMLFDSLYLIRQFYMYLKKGKRTLHTTYFQLYNDNIDFGY